jgi:hypothetical protein
VAVKVPVRQNLTPKQLDEFRHEVSIMKRIFHPNVVLFLVRFTKTEEKKKKKKKKPQQKKLNTLRVLALNLANSCW